MSLSKENINRKLSELKNTIVSLPYDHYDYIMGISKPNTPSISEGISINRRLIRFGVHGGLFDNEEHFCIWLKEVKDERNDRIDMESARFLMELRYPHTLFQTSSTDRDSTQASTQLSANFL